MIENNFLLCLIDLCCSLELILSTVELAAEVIFELLTDLLYKHIKIDWQT